MLKKDRISLGLSITIAGLIIILIILLVSIFVSDFFTIYVAKKDEEIVTFAILTFVFCVLSLGLYIPSSIMYIYGIHKNNSTQVKIGFGLGLPAWILGIFSSAFFLEVAYMTQEIFESSLWGSISLFLQIASPMSLFPLFINTLPSIPLWSIIFAVLNIISGITDIVLGSIIVTRIKSKTKRDVELMTPMEPKPRPTTIKPEFPPEKVEIRYVVPEICPHCKAPLSNTSVNWIGPLEARCSFCDALIKAKKEEI